jgi:pre-rRNA-processing protein IPI1
VRSFSSWPGYESHRHYQSNIRPHCPLLLLFTTSAQTHIFPEIRIDAIRFLDLFLDIIPETVVVGWTESGGTQGHSHGGRVLQGYLGILNAGTTYGEGGGRSKRQPPCAVLTQRQTRDLFVQHQQRV